MLIAFSGPSGIGKDFLKKKLLNDYPYLHELQWLTTRPLRQEETVARSNREHISFENFSQLVANGDCVLEQELYGHHYGVRKSDLMLNDLCLITEIHPYNVIRSLNINPAIIFIGLITPELSLLEKRLLSRNPSEPSLGSRIQAAIAEMSVIRLNQNLFAGVINVTELNQNSVYEQLLSFIHPYLK